jgi:hypothetical protein
MVLVTRRLLVSSWSCGEPQEEEDVCSLKLAAPEMDKKHS